MLEYSLRPPMALFKTRPNVRLLLARPLVAGEIGEYIVELDCPKPVPVDAITLTLFGDVVWIHSGQYGRNRYTSRFLEHKVSLLDEARELDEGKHRKRAKIKLSPELPSSWEGDRLAIEYGVKVHVDIPWWPDARAEFVVRVIGGAPPLENMGAKVYVTNTDGPPAKGSYLELSLNHQWIAPGGVLRATAALGNVAQIRYRQLIVALTAQESIPMAIGGNYINEHVVARWSVPVPEQLVELQPIPFKLTVPESIAPGFELHDCRLRWLLQLRANVPWGPDPSLRVPVEIQPGRSLDEGEVAAPLAVGSDRLRLIWTAVAKATGLDFVDGRLLGRAGSARIEVRRSHLQGKARVLGTLEFPPLGVGLEARYERRGLLGGRELQLAARDPAQTRVLDEQLGPRFRAIEGAGKDYEIVTSNDSHLRFALEGAGLQLEPLREFVNFLGELATSLPRVRELLPPPAVLADQAEAWAEAAEALRGELRQSDLQLSIVRDELRVLVGTDFDAEGQVRATHLELWPGVPIPSRHHLIWTGETQLPEHAWPIAEWVRPPTWAPGGRVALVIEAERVRLFLPAPLPDPREENPRIEQLFALGRRLRGEKGPYR